MSRWLENLNPEQREAVSTIEGPLLVLAGAGSGKTRVITHRVAHMISQGIDPENILGVTFTNKAAEEMRQRLTGMVGPVAARVTLSTFHSLGLEMLRAESKGKRRKAALTVFDTGDQLSCLREMGRRTHLERSLDLGSILQRISAYKNAFLSAEAVERQCGDDDYDQAAAILYPLYLEQLEAYGAVDFDDLVCRPCQLMEADEACRQRWSDRFRYVLVDEYQDTNSAQLRLLKAIAGQHKNLCVVGDDDQSIYGWRGAEVKNILQFAKDFPGGKTVYLMRNYRSVPPVLSLANAVIQSNAGRHEKSLVPVRQGGPAVQMVLNPDGEAEARWIVEHLKGAMARGIRARDMAVLYRSNLFPRDLESELRAEGVAYRILGGTAFYETKEVKDVLAYLRICANPGDEISLRRVINAPSRGIGPKTVADLSAWAEKQGKSFYLALRQAQSILGASSRPAASVAQFMALTDRYRKLFGRGSQLAHTTRELMEELRLEEYIRQGPGSPQSADKRVARLRSLLDGLTTYCNRAPQPSLAGFLGRVALDSSEGDADAVAGEEVTLSTLHGSKGLEFKLVVLAGMEEGYLPHERTINPHQNDLEGGDIAEERRLLYVGITRAMDELVLTRCRERILRGKMQPRTPTRFLDEIPAELLSEDDRTRPLSMDEVKGMMASLMAQLEA